MDSVEGFNMEDKQASTEELFKTSNYGSSSEESPSIISSLIEMEDSPKMKLYRLGLYEPGSGEICTKYITMSRSSMIRHSYYKYPGLKDPGIMRALLYPEDEKLYEEDGQELYLDLCKQMNIIPVRCFYRDLKKTVVNLRYYGVNPVGIRAMCLALAFNKTVKRLDLTSNYLNHDDACYHLGQLLGDRNALQEIVLEGCNIGHRGLKRLVVYLHKRKMQLLDLTCNNIRDEGFIHLAYELQEGAVINNLKLRRNDLTSDSLTVLAEVIEFNDTIKHLDLSWNKFMKQKGPSNLIRILSNSQVLKSLNLSWTGLSMTTELRSLFCIETLKELDLSNNRLPSLASRAMARSLVLAKNLEVLNLSCNPFTPSDALYVLIRMKNEKVNLRELYLDHILVSKEFIQELKEIMTLSFRKNATITHGDVLRNYVLPEQDIRVITVRRIVLTMKKKRKNTLDILLYLLEQQKKHKFLDTADLTRTLKLNNIPVNDDYITDLTKLFPGPKTDNGNRTINLNRIVDYIHRLWPDKKLPPTPPPTPPPVLPPITKKKGKKGKGPSNLIRILSNSQVLKSLNLSWTGLSMTTELRSLFCIETLKDLDLSNNRLPSLASRAMARSLVLAKNLEVLNLSCNPFTPSDALYVLIRMKNEKVNLRELYLDHILVSKEFIQELKEIMTLSFRKNATITHGDVLRNYVLPEQDIRVITVRRIVLTMKKKRKNTLDILLYLLEQQKKHKFLDTADLTRTLKLNNIPVNDDYITDLTKLFPGPKTDNGNRTINLNRIVDYIHRLWPDKKLPPTPPPTPPPVLPPITKKKGKKGKGKKGK